MSGTPSWGRVRGSLAARIVALVLVSILAASAAYAADSTNGGADVTDYRDRVMLAYGLVFALVITYLMLSHRKNAHVRDEIDFLERRLNRLRSASGKPDDGLSE